MKENQDYLLDMKMQRVLRNKPNCALVHYPGLEVIIPTQLPAALGKSLVFSIMDACVFNVNTDLLERCINIMGCRARGSD